MALDSYHRRLTGKSLFCQQLDGIKYGCATQTVVCGLLSYSIVLPNSLETAPFLTADEHVFARIRICLTALLYQWGMVEYLLHHLHGVLYANVATTL